MINRRNPYIVGSVVRDRDFYDHEYLCEELLDSHRSCISLIGNRRMGKSSLLVHLAERSESGDFNLYFNPQGLSRDLKKLGKSLKRDISRKALQKNLLLTFVENQNQNQNNICDLLMDLVGVAENENLRINLFIDEGISLEPQEEKQLNTALRCSSSLHVVLAGNKTLIDKGLMDGFQTIFLPPFENPSAEEVISQIQNVDGKVMVYPEDIEKIRNATGNHPFYIQMLCYKLYQNNSSSLRPLRPEDLQPDFQLDLCFRDEYELYNSEDQQVLNCLSTGPCSLDDLHRKLPKIENLVVIVDMLFKLGTLSQKDGGYTIASTFFARWLANRHP